VDALLSTVAELKAAQSYLHKAICREKRETPLQKKRPGSLIAKLSALDRPDRADTFRT
jgi:hypothetical protein